MSGKKIDIFLDIPSFFSFVAVEDVIQNLNLLTANGVEVEFHPVLLGGINNASGNRPPWTLEAKANYLKRPHELVAHHLPLRALHYIKANYPPSTFLSALHTLFHKFWMRGSVNITKDDVLRDVLLNATEKPDGGKKLFTSQGVDEIMAGRAAMKDALKESTGRAIKLGAFGAPWIWARNAQGVEEPFFGSDRFNHIYRFLDLPFQDVKVLPPKSKL
ncbi:Glutathione S-transferase kappa 1-like protein [Cladobotryum mycophilum]|uniref:Glutathione S-transferase kappa 1-like protein n=1 Tax=Cladobotryum mycophilum TaxID=491253 RepID=A0ABR0SDX0_9HYPO